jgi:hypothetical protein
MLFDVCAVFGELNEDVAQQKKWVLNNDWNSNSIFSNLIITGMLNGVQHIYTIAWILGKNHQSQHQSQMIKW